MQLTREETFLTHRARPQTDIKLRLGMRRDGRITACACEVVQRGGAYAGYGIVTILYAGALLQGLYDIPAVKYDGYRVYTNLPPCGAMRGHGSVDTRHAFECLLDRMARELGLDPFAVRRANLLHAPTRTLNDLMVNSYGLAECLDKVERASEWRERIGKLPPGKGLGMACSHYVSGAAKPIHWTGEPHAVVNIRLDFDGGITALTGAADIGQGSSTMVAIAVAETLGISLDRVRVIAADTAITPKDNGAYSSRITFMVGNAAIDAAKTPEGHSGRGGGAEARIAPRGCRDASARSSASAAARQSSLPFAEVVKAALVDRGADHRRRERSPARPSPRAASIAAAPSGRRWGSATPRRSSKSASMKPPGCVTVDKVWTALDCGHAINALAVEGQIEGSVWMGMGQALCEETRYVDGLPVHASLLEYRMPTIAESPPIEVHIVESHDPFGPFGRQGSERGRARRLPACPGQRGRQRHRHRHRRIAGDARPSDGSADPAAPAGAARQHWKAAS